MKKTQKIAIVQDGVEYTLVKASTKRRPAKRQPSEAQRLNGCLMKLMNRYFMLHSDLLDRSIAHSAKMSARNAFVHVNHAHLKVALLPLAQAAPKNGTVDDRLIDEAVSRYAEQHPRAVVILTLPGYEEVFLAGPFPKELELNRIEMRERLVKIREAVKVRAGVIK